MGYFAFAGDDPDDYWANICANDLRVLSMGAAVRSYCSTQETVRGWNVLRDYCTDNAYHLADWDALGTNLTDAFIQSLHIVQFEDIAAGDTWNESVLISPTLYATAYRTTAVFQNEYELHKDYGWAVYGFWAIVLLYGMFLKLIRSVDAVKTSSMIDPENAGTHHARPRPNSFMYKLSSWIHTNLLVPATLGSHHQRPLWTCTIPTRVESMVVVSFYVLNLVLCCVSYEIFSPNLYYTEAIQTWRYVADRTGIICYANLPWLWMFSGRNNIFIWLTGWSFNTFNVFHRHIARVATIQAIVHSISYTAIEANYNELAASWQEEYWYMGGMATIAMSLLLGFSTLWLRRRMYEVFLIVHVAFAVLIIVGLFYHTAIFEGEYNGYLWPLVGIWLFDRLARVARLAYCNVRVSFGSRQLLSEAEVRYNKDGHMLELKISPSAQNMRLDAGQHYFIYQSSGWKMWENHPFTLASWTSLRNRVISCERRMPATASGLVHLAPKSVELSSGISSPTQSDNSVVEAVEPESLVFYVRPYDSWTRRLQASCLKSPTSSISTRMLIEGPYGHRAPLHTFQNVVFIVGGSGITAALPYLQEFIANQNSAECLTREVTFVWTLRQAAMVHEIMEQNLRPLLAMDNIKCRFHITSQPFAARPQVEKADAVPDRTLSIQYEQERPDICAIVSQVVANVAEAGDWASRVAVFACGPAGMADEARASVHGALKAHKGRVNVRYFEESFGW